MIYQFILIYQKSLNIQNSIYYFKVIKWQKKMITNLAVPQRQGAAKLNQ